MRIFSLTILFFLFCGICEAATQIPSPAAPSPAYGQAIWEVILQGLARLTDFPATDKYAKYAFWAGLINILSGLFSFAAIFLLLQTPQSPLLVLVALTFIISYAAYAISQPIALIFGIIALRQIKKRPDEYAGKKWAVNGILFSLFWTLLALIYLITRI
jgi:hypothetical protein